MDLKCVNCKTKDCNLFTCSHCYGVLYCGTKCQETHVCIGNPTPASNISKNETIPTEWLMEIVRNWLFTEDDQDHQFLRPIPREVDKYINFIKIAARRGNAEGQWLLALITKEGQPTYVRTGLDIKTSLEDQANWILGMLPEITPWSKDVPYAYYYRAMALLQLNCFNFSAFMVNEQDYPNLPDFKEIRLLLNESCRYHFGPAFAALSKFYSYRDEYDNKYRVLFYGSEYKDATSTHMFSGYNPSPDSEIYLNEAANLGSTAAMEFLDYKFKARAAFLTGNLDYFEIYEYTAEQKKTQKYVHKLYMIGKEMDGFDSFWNEPIRDPFVNECIEIYTTVIQRTRAAVLQLVQALQDKLPGELIYAITSRVYQERERDVFLWYTNPQKIQEELERDAKRQRS